MLNGRVGSHSLKMIFETFSSITYDRDKPGIQIWNYGVSMTQGYQMDQSLSLRLTKSEILWQPRGIMALWQLPLQHVPGCRIYDRIWLQCISGHREDDALIKKADYDQQQKQKQQGTTTNCSINTYKFHWDDIFGGGWTIYFNKYDFLTSEDVPGLR